MACQKFSRRKGNEEQGWWFKKFAVNLITPLCIVVLLHANPVWTGFACLENPCFHGICIDYLDINSTHQCYCRNGFTGYSCQINWDDCRSNPCMNNGQCFDQVASFNCSCPENFAGTLCQYDLSACDEIFPCQNNGTCALDPNSSNGTFMCICPHGFSGQQCEIDVSVCNTTEDVCLNGRCVDGIGINFHCECQPGWSGRLCEIDIDECQSSPCRNGGICINARDDYSCACPFGYTGKSCESKLRICEYNPCKNNAFCLHEDEDETKLTCYCVPDYHGTLCEQKYDDCLPDGDLPRCFNGGTCIDGVGEFSCSCPSNFFGPTCQCTIDNITDPECHYNETLIPSISEIPFIPSISITEPALISSKIQPISATPLASSISTIIISHPTPEETLTLFPPLSIMPLPSQPMEEQVSSAFVLSISNVLPEATVFPTESIKPTEWVSRIYEESVTSFSFQPHPSPTLDSILPATSPQIGPTAVTESETIYEPCPTISIEGSEGMIMPSSLITSLSESAYLNRTYESADLLTTSLVSEELYYSTLSILHPALNSTGISEEIISKPETLISMMEPSSEIVQMTITSAFFNGSALVELTQSIAPPERDIVSSEIHPQIEPSIIISSESHPEIESSIPSSLITDIEQISLSSIFNESLVTLPSSEIFATTIQPYLPISSQILVISESVEFKPEFSTVELAQTILPRSSELYSEEYLFSPIMTPLLPFSLLSPSTSQFSLLSTPALSTEILTSPSIILESEESAVVFTTLLETHLVPPVSLLPSEEILNASRRSDDIALPPLLFTTTLAASYDDSSLLLSFSSMISQSFSQVITPTPTLTPTTTLTIPVKPSSLILESISELEELTVTASPSVSLPVTTSEPLVTISPSASLPLTTSEPSVTILLTPTPSPSTPIPTTPADLVGNISDPCMNYCQNDAKCISTSIQPVCICPFKFFGDRCEILRKKFSTASFTGDSFLGYLVPNESINRINVATDLATNAPEGILFYTSVGKLYALIFIQGGHVTLHFSCGAQSMHFVETRTRVDNGFNFTLQFNMELVVHGVSELHCVGQVSVNHSYIMRGEQIVGHNGPYGIPIQMIYLGGVGAPNAHKNDELIGILPGFKGCLYSLKINEEGKDLFNDAVDGNDVSECTAFGCVTNPCFGSSKCALSETFPFWECICPPGYQGARCQIRVCDSNPCLNGATCTFPSDDNTNNVTVVGKLNSNNISHPFPICLCSIGFSGSMCQSKINITKPSFKPIMGFDYSAYIAYEPIPQFVDWVQLKFHFVTNNISQIALLVYSGYNHNGNGHLSVHPSDQLEKFEDLIKDGNSEQEGNHQSDDLPNNDVRAYKISDFFAITFVHGYVALTWNLGSGTHRIITPGRIDKRLNVHTLFAGRAGRQAWLKVDGMRNVTGKSPGPFHRLNVNTELFVGGYEGFRFEGLPHDLPLHKGFEGCIFDFGFRVKNRLYLPRTMRGRNVKNCYEEDC